MFRAAMQGNVEELKKLIAKGANMFSLQRRQIPSGYYGGHSLLHAASFVGHLHMAKYFIEECNFHLFIEDRVNWTPLLYAAQSGHVEVARYLTKKGSDINKTDKFGRTILYYATRYHHPSVSHYLIRQGADVNINDDFGDTALRVAMHNDDVATVKLLIDYGAKANAYTLDFRMRDLGVSTWIREELEADKEMVAFLENSTGISLHLHRGDLLKQTSIELLRDELVRKILYRKLCEINSVMSVHPTCFISYVWDSDRHKKWVQQLAEDLKTAGITIYLDVWDNPPGTKILEYIKKINTSDFVLLIGSPGLTEKYIQYQERKGSPVVSSELDRVDARLMKNAERPDSVIPLLRSGTVENAFHPTIQDYTLVYQDFTKDANYIPELLKLIKKVGKFSSNEERLETITKDLQSIEDALKKLSDEQISEYGERMSKIKSETSKATESVIQELLHGKEQ